VTVLRYSLLRTLLLFACMFTLYLVGVRDPLPLLLLTGVTSIVLSYFLLKGPREAMARTIAEHAQRRMPAVHPDDLPSGAQGATPARRTDLDALAEDREDDARRAP
jgi:hypothetical protein